MVFSSPHRFSVGLPSGLYAVQSSETCVLDHRCVGRQSTNSDPILLLTILSWLSYPSFVMSPSTLTRFSLPDALKHPRRIILPPPCFTVLGFVHLSIVSPNISSCFVDASFTNFTSRVFLPLPDFFWTVVAFFEFLDNTSQSISWHLEMLWWFCILISCFVNKPELISFVFVFSNESSNLWSFYILCKYEDNPQI